MGRLSLKTRLLAVMGRVKYRCEERGVLEVSILYESVTHKSLKRRNVLIPKCSNRIIQGAHSSASLRAHPLCMGHCHFGRLWPVLPGKSLNVLI